MTRDDIIRMAEEAGFECIEYMNDRVYAGEELGSLTTFAQLVAAHEREQIAEMMDAKGGRMVNTAWVSEAIRARK